MGPTPAELESINELIRFDHVYTKAESQSTVVSQKSSRQRAPLISILPKRTNTVPIVIVDDNCCTRQVDAEVNMELLEAATQSSQQQAVEVKEEEMRTTENNDIEDSLGIDDVEHGVLSLEDTLEHLFDIPELLQENLFPAIPTTPVQGQLLDQSVPMQGVGQFEMPAATSVCSEVHHTSVYKSNVTNRRKLSCPRGQSKKHLTINISDTCPISQGVSSPPVAALDTPSSFVKSCGSLSDSVYSSELGDAASPGSMLSFSDSDSDNLSLELEDSAFMSELFPTLL